VARFEQFVGEIDEHVALGDHFTLIDLADPVVWQIRAGQEQAVGTEIADIIPNEDLARTGDDQMQFVFLVVVPAHQRARKTMLTVDQRVAVVIVHQFVGWVGDL
jgi:hypothetical protein